MLALATLAGALAALIWMLLLFARGGFWRVRRCTASPPHGSSQALRIAAVVPARNEAEFIAASVLSLLDQGVDLFLVDDDSTDATSAVARAAAADAGKSASLTVIPSKPLPAGWSGKLWALQQGVESALQISPDFLLLTDADIVHGPRTVATLTALADGGYDLVSLMVKLHCRSFAEKLLIPAFVFFFFLLYPPAWSRGARRRTAGAAGGCMLIRPQALERAGGLAAIRGEIIDDCALARAIKRSGGRVSLWLTSASASVRPYDSWSGMRRMISRTAFNQLRHSSWLLFLTLFALIVVYLSPPLLLFAASAAPVLLGTAASIVPLALGATAWGLMSFAYLPLVRFYGLHPGWALTLPLAAAFYAGATVDSAIRYWRGRGGEWKGRMQDSSPG